MKLVLASKSATTHGSTTERLINLYANPAPEGARTSMELRSVPGLREFSSVPGPFLRAMGVVQGVLHIVAKGGLYRVAASGAVSYLAAVADDRNTSIAGHRSAVTVAASGTYYVFSGITISQPASGRISNVGSVTFQSQYTLLSERGGREIEWTVAGTPGTRNALYFATAEARDDNLIRGMASGNYVWEFKEKSTEIWGTAGSTTNAFTRVPGAVIDTGLLDFNLVTKTPAGLFFVGSDRVAYMTRGAGIEAVSTPAVHQALKDCRPTHCFYYEDRGHPFCCIRFEDRPALCLDVSSPSWAGSNLWHERSTGAQHEPWDIIAAEFVYGQWVLGSRLGGVYNLGAAPHDSGKTLRRTAVSRPLYSDGDRFSVNMLEIIGNFGSGGVVETVPSYLLDELGFPLRDEEGRPLLAEVVGDVQRAERPARLWIRVSKDGGHTWPKTRIRDVGKKGGWRALCRFRALGEYRQFTVEVNVTDPVDILLLGEANVS